MIVYRSRGQYQLMGQREPSLNGVSGVAKMALISCASSLSTRYFVMDRLERKHEKMEVTYCCTCQLWRRIKPEIDLDLRPVGPQLYRFVNHKTI